MVESNNYELVESAAILAIEKNYSEILNWLSNSPEKNVFRPRT